MTDPLADTPPAPAVGDPAPAPTEAGPAPGFVYASLGSRAVAIIIDVVIVGFIYALVVAALATVGGWGAFVIGGLIYVALSIGYFVILWTRRRATAGQQLLGLETARAADGATLTQDQALRRWAFLMGPGAVAQVFGYGGALLGGLGLIIAGLALAYELYLLYTASQSPTRQGFHDIQAGTIVVKRTR